MAEIESLKIFNFRNISGAKIEIRAPFVCFYGQNAQGKTNILESIYLTSNIRSFRTGNTKDWISYSHKQAKISIDIKDELGSQELSYEINKGFRKYYINGKPVNGIRELIERFRVVAYSPSSYELILGDDSERRAFLDKLVYSMDTKHLDDLIYYNKALKNRNLSIKTGAEYWLWDDSLASSGSRIITRRIRGIDLLKKYLRETFYSFFGNKHELDFMYKPSSGVSYKDIKERFHKERKNDELRGTTCYGAHRDKISIMFNNREAKSVFSTGQAKLVAFLFKVSKARFIKEFSGQKPIFLYDDVSTFLDEKRLCQLVEIIKEENIQVLSSSVDNNLFKTLFSDSVQFITVREGRVDYDG